MQPQSSTLSDLDAKILANPSDPQAWMDRGKLKLKQADFEEACSDFDKAIELNPSNSEAYYCRGLSSASQDNTQ